jgi:nucleotide-binding universal stress UspA family protein
MLQSNHRPISLDRHRAAAAPRRPSIVCGLDGTAGSVEIARIGARLALGLRGAVEYVHVLDAGRGPRPAHVVEAERERARAMLDGLQDSSEAPGRSRLVEFGDPGRRLAAVAEDVQAEMLVVGRRGDDSRSDDLLGSVSARLAADAPCPVLIVPPKLQHHVRPSAWSTRTIVCGFDTSAAAWESALRAARIAAPLGCRLKLVSVQSQVSWLLSEVAQELSGRLSRPGMLPPGCATPVIEWEWRGGDPAWELECVAATATAPFVAIGSRGV